MPYELCINILQKILPYFFMAGSRDSFNSKWRFMTSAQLTGIIYMQMKDGMKDQELTTTEPIITWKQYCWGPAVQYCKDANT